MFWMNLGKAFSNVQTTVVGWVAGILLVWQGNGFQWPQTKHDWTALIGGAALAVLGTVAKDGRTGSLPLS